MSDETPLDEPTSETTPVPSPTQPSFLARHATAVRIAVAAAIAIVLFGAGAVAATAIDNDEGDRPPGHAKGLKDGRGLGAEHTKKDRKKNGPGAKGIAGQISSIDGSKIVIAGPRGLTTVNTNDKTSVTTTSNGAFSDIAVGDPISVAGTRTDSTIAATAIREDGSLGKPGRGVGRAETSGIVTKLENGVITLQTPDNSTLTINTSATTTYAVTKSAKVSDLKVGQLIAVAGSTDSNGVVSATQIIEGQTKVKGPRNVPGKGPHPNNARM